MSTIRLKHWIESAEIVWGVDVGYIHGLQAGARPSLLLGDLDSVDSNLITHDVEVVHLPDQDRTDSAKTLSWAEEQGFRRIHLACSEGDSPDHQLQTIFTAASSNLDVWFAFERGVGRIIRSEIGEFHFASASGARVSLIPIAPSTGVTFQGVKWPLDAAQLEPLGASSISNIAAESKVSVRIQTGSCLLYWETDDLIWE